ncbi:MAG: Spy/CpxP family protein refolding chaperone, partial [Mariprofundaceae bacterium]
PHGAHLADALDLSQAQPERMRHIREQAREKIRPLRKAMHENHVALRDLDPGASGYMERVKKLAREQAELVRKMVIAHARVRAEVHKVLTKAQRQRLRALKKRRCGRRGPLRGEPPFEAE